MRGTQQAKGIPGREAQGVEMEAQDSWRVLERVSRGCGCSKASVGAGKDQGRKGMGQIGKDLAYFAKKTKGEVLRVP